MQGKVSLERSAATRVYVGIDVCKAWLDVHVHPIGQTFRVPNTRNGLTQLKRRLANLHVALIAMEATGKFHREAHRNLHASGFVVAVINPLRSRLFAEATGQLAKTDTVDARMLALLAAMLEPKAKAPPPEALEILQEIVRGREAFVAQRTALLNQLGTAKTACLRQQIRRQLKTLEGAIERLETEIERRIAANPALARRFAILTSIPGLGKIAAATLLANFAELGACTPKQAAMIAGLAPIACDSGDTKGQRHIRGGRASLRTGIYMAALAATRFNADLKCFYDRLIANGKQPKVAITAVMRKLIALANTLIPQDRLWQPLHP
jgi:transposase